MTTRHRCEQAYGMSASNAQTTRLCTRRSAAEIRSDQALPVRTGLQRQNAYAVNKGKTRIHTYPIRIDR